MGRAAGVKVSSILVNCNRLSGRSTEVAVVEYVVTGGVQFFCL